MPKLIAIHPGDILKTEFLEPLGISPFRLSRELHVSAPRVNDIVLGRCGSTAEMVLRLGRFFGTTPQIWSNLQAEYDRRVAMNALESKELTAIRPYAGRQNTFTAGSAIRARSGSPRIKTTALSA